MSYPRPPMPYSNLADGSLDFNGGAVLGIVPVGNVYTMTSSIIADSVTIRNGYRVALGQNFLMARLLTLETGSFLSANGNSAVGGTPGAAILGGSYLGWAAGAGGASASRTTVGVTNGTAGGGSGGSNVAGTGGNGGNGDTATGGAGNSSAVLPANQFRYWRSPQFAWNGWKMPPTTTGTAFTLTNAGGGGGSGGVRITAQAGADAATSGAGGGAGGIVCVYAGTFDSLGTIEALGGNGGNGVVGASVTGTAGGGGGGSGGAIHLCMERLVRLGNLSVTGGAGGNGAGAVTTNYNGLQGTVGTVCAFLRGESL